MERATSLATAFDSGALTSASIFTTTRKKVASRAAVGPIVIITTEESESERDN